MPPLAHPNSFEILTGIMLVLAIVSLVYVLLKVEHYSVEQENAELYANVSRRNERLTGLIKEHMLQLGLCEEHCMRLHDALYKNVELRQMQETVLADRDDAMSKYAEALLAVHQECNRIKQFVKDKTYVREGSRFRKTTVA